MTQEHLFTAAEIARALGSTRQNVHARLSKVPADGEKFEKFAGKPVRAWQTGSLPPDLLRKALAIRASRNYAKLDAVFSSPTVRFELRDAEGHSLALAELAPAAVEKARKLRDAMREPLKIRNEAMPAAEFEAQGVEAYRREFGYPITTKHWRKLLERTVERDGGFEEWNRLEIYCDDAGRQTSCSTPAVAASSARDHELPILDDFLSSLDGAAKLDAQQRAFLWTKVCDELQSCCDNGRKLKKAKRAVLDVLAKSGLLCSDVETLRRTLSRKWAEFSATDRKQCVDRRLLRVSADLPTDDKAKLVARSLDCGGRVAQAFRELHRNGELSPETTDRFISNPASKSHVPRSVRRVIAPKVKRLMLLHHGPREHELSGAFVRRDYSNMAAGDSYQADDCTCPVYYWEHDAGSPHGYRILRGQWLLMIDERSRLALGFALHSENNYNARVIRALITRVHDGFGLPRKRFYFERGIWRESRILTGDKRDSTELGLGHTEQGLREYGVAFAHAKLPRGKVIERVLGIVQNQMERLPGYVGRNEVSDRMERVQKHISEVRSGRVHASKFFLSKEAWQTTLAKLLDGYNSEPQEGHLGGLSPLQCWNRFQSAEGLVQFGTAARYLLAHHKVKMKVQRNGITLRQSLGGGTYCGEATGAMQHEHVWAWFNPEEPEYIAITSLDGKRGPFVVPRLDTLPAIGATAEQLATAGAQINAHNDQARTAYRLISPHLARHSFRPLVIDSKTIEQGEQLESSLLKARAETTKSVRAVQRAHRAARHHGMRVPIGRNSAESVNASARLLDDVFGEQEGNAQ